MTKLSWNMKKRMSEKKEKVDVKIYISNVRIVSEKKK